MDSLDHVFSYIGFIVAAFIGQAVMDYYKDDYWKK